MKKEFFNQIAKGTYTKRKADTAWMELIQTKACVTGKSAADIGAGGGIYSIALAELGAKNVTGIDISENMIEGAKENCRDYPSIHFQLGTSSKSNLPDSAVDLVLERALIHHLNINQLSESFTEAKRVLTENGIFIIQDRTIEDCMLPGSDEHLRGYFFEFFPNLKEKDISRRYSVETVNNYLSAAGFHNVDVVTFWENRKIYDSMSELKEEILSRKGRSILFELTDEQLQILADKISGRVKSCFPLVEKERWTIWFAKK